MATSARKQPAPRTVRISDRQLIGLYGQLGRMLEAGLPITEALDLCARHSPARVSGALRSMREGVEQGQALSQAAAAAFPASAAVLIKAAERTGALPAALRSLATAAELRQEVRRQVVRSCILPLVLFTLVFFIPKAYLLFTAGWVAYLQASLVPYLMGLGSLVLLVWGLPRVLTLLLGADRSARAVRAVPVLSRLYQLAARVRFCRNLSSAMEAGLGMRECLELAAQATGHPQWHERLARAAGYVERGGTLYQALERVGLLDQDLLLAVASGERAGKLPESLEQQARLAQSSLTHQLNVALQVLSVTVLLGTYVFVATRVVQEYETVLGGANSQLQQLMKEAGGQGGQLNDLMQKLQKETGGIKLDEILRRAKDPAGLEQFPPDVRKHLE